MKIAIFTGGQKRAGIIKGVDYILGALSPILILGMITLFIIGFWKIGIILAAIILIILARIFLKALKEDK